MYHGADYVYGQKRLQGVRKGTETAKIQAFSALLAISMTCHRDCNAERTIEAEDEPLDVPRSWKFSIFVLFPVFYFAFISGF
jgi:hypothetical protein